MVECNKSSFFVSCVIPAHNEADNIKNLIYKIKPVLEGSTLVSSYELIIVNDNSSDTTGRIITHLSEKDLHIKVVHRIDTPGFGNAVKAGLAEATGDIIIPVMADLSDDPHDIILLIEKIHDGYDVVYGSRFIEGGELHGYPVLKRIANRSFNNVLRFMFGMPLRDITNAFKAYRREVIVEIGVDNLTSSGFDLTAELPLKAYIAGFAATEVPVRWYNRTAGEAHLKLSRNATVYGFCFLRMFVSGSIIAIRDLLGILITGSKIGILLSFILGFIVVLLFLALIGVSSVVTHLTMVSPGFVGLSVCAVLIAFLFRLWRWRVIYRASGYCVSRTSLFRAMMAGWMLNYLLPGRIGDISRAFILKGTDDIPAGLSLATVVVERIFDLVTLSLLLGICAVFLGQEVLFVQIIIGILILLLAGGLIILMYSEATLKKILKGRMDIIIKSIHTIRNGLSLMSRNYWAISLSLALSILVWVFEAYSLYFSAKALHFDVLYLQTMFAGIAGYLVSSLPVTPAAVGLYEASVAGGFSLFGIDLSDGVTIAILDHVIRTILIIGVGTLCIIQIGFQIRHHLRKTVRENENDR